MRERPARRVRGRTTRTVVAPVAMALVVIAAALTASLAVPVAPAAAAPGRVPQATPVPAAGAPVGTVSVVDSPSIDTPGPMITAPNGDLWFINTNGIGRITTAGVVKIFRDAGIDHPQDLAAGSDGNIWFTNQRRTVGRLTPSGTVTTFLIDPYAAPGEIVAGADGALWADVTGPDFSSKVYRVATDGTMAPVSSLVTIGGMPIAAGADGSIWHTSLGSHLQRYLNGVVTDINYPTTDDRFLPIHMAVTADGNVWFTNRNNAIGRFTPAGVGTYFTDPAIVDPGEITVGPDGALWFTNGDTSIGRISTSGVVTTFSHPSIHSPSGIAAGADGALWFTNATTNTIGRMTTAGAVTATYAKKGIGSPEAITQGADGNLWFTNGPSSIGRVTPAGVVTELIDPSIHSPRAIVAGPDGALWFLNENTPGAALGRISTAGVVTTFAGPTIADTRPIAAGDGFLWFFAEQQLWKATPAGAITSVATFTGITGQDLPTRSAAIAMGPDHSLYLHLIYTWVTTRESYISAIVRLGQDGASGGFVDLDPTDEDPYNPVEVRSIVAGPDGNIWAAAKYGTIIRITPALALTRYAPTEWSGPNADRVAAIAPGADGALWFTQRQSDTSPAGRIGRITTAGTISSFAAPSIHAPTGITAGPDGAMWFASSSSGTIGRIQTIVQGSADVSTYATLDVPDPPYTTPPPTVPTLIQAGPAKSLKINVFVDGDAVPPRTQDWPLTIAFTLPPGFEIGPVPAPWSCTSGPSTSCRSAENLGLSRLDVPLRAGASVKPGQYTLTFSVDTGTVTDTDPSNNTTSLTLAVGGSAALAVDLDAQVTHGPAFTGTAVLSNPGPSEALVVQTMIKLPHDVGDLVYDAPDFKCSVNHDDNQHHTTIWCFRIEKMPVGSASTISFSGIAPGGLDPGQAQASIWLGSWTPTPENAPPAVETVPLPALAGMGASFHPLSPTRLLDSRGPVGGWSGPVTAGAPRTLDLSSIVALPDRLAAVVLNVTVTESTADSFLTAFPAGGSPPTASNLNFAKGQTVANLVTVAVSPEDAVAFATATGSTHVVVDVVGYYGDNPADRFNAVDPTRILDSRVGPGFTGPVVAGWPRILQVTSPTGAVPATADAVVMNVTVTGGTQNSFLTAYPAYQPPPIASNLNFGAGETRANLVTVKLSVDGSVRLANAVGSVDVVADVVGYFDHTQGDLFHSVVPTRMLDSRTATGGWNGPVAAGAPRALDLRSGPGGATSTAVVANVTVTESTLPTYVTVTPTGVDGGGTSNVNAAARQTIANLVTTKVGAAGSITLQTNTGTTHVVLDLFGWYAPT
jgi:streptogramin lyase